MTKYVCKLCGKDFVSYNSNPSFCSLKCKGDYQSPTIDIHLMRELYHKGKTQLEVGEILGVSQKSVCKAMRRNGIKARVAAKRNQLMENNSSWKADKAGRQAFHKRLYAEFGKPKSCSMCGTTEAKHFDYANLTGRYEDINDYLPMCRSCHWIYDKKINNIKHMKERRENARIN